MGDMGGGSRQKSFIESYFVLSPIFCNVKKLEIKTENEFYIKTTNFMHVYSALFLNIWDSKIFRNRDIFLPTINLI